MLPPQPSRGPGDPRTLTGRPWDSLDDFIRQDNILQIRSIMTAVVARGRRWVPGRAVVPGSFIELSEHDLEAVARAEHTRWYRRRLAAGWSATGPPDRHRPGGTALVNSRVVPWSGLPAADRRRAVNYLRSQLGQLEDVGFLPVIPPGGPPGAAGFQRTGTVRARRLHARRPWTRRSGDELHGNAGDWRVIDDGGDERTVRDPAFRDSHALLGGEIWLRTGTFRAWQVSEADGPADDGGAGGRPAGRLGGGRQPGRALAGHRRAVLPQLPAHPAGVAHRAMVRRPGRAGPRSG